MQRFVQVDVVIGGLHKPVAVCCHDGAATPVLQGAAGGAGDRTGVLLWAACRVLCAYVVADAAPAHARATVVELGTGAGLAGAVAALHFPNAVLTVTDGATEALSLCERTLAANGLAGRVALAQLSWDDPAAHTAPAAHACVAADSVDLLLGAEIVYPSGTLGSLRNLFALARRVLRRRRVPPADVTAVAHNGGSDGGGVFAMAYVPRCPETTLALLHAAWAAGLRWRLAPAADFWRAPEPPPLGAVVLEFRRHGDNDDGDSSCAGYSDPALHADVDALLAEAQYDIVDATTASPSAATFAGALHASFPGVVPAILAERALRAEIEDDYRQELSALGGAFTPDDTS
jgi:hypothetical protein